MAVSTHQIVFLVFFVFSSNLFRGDGYETRSGPLLKNRPHWLKLCRRSDPNVNRCLNDLFLKMFPELAKGIPEMNVDGFEPLTLEKVSISKGSGPVTISGSLYNLTVVGPSKAVPTYVKVDFEKKHYNFGIFLPSLDIKSQYDLTGKILVLPLIGNGDCEVNLTGVQTQVTTNVSYVEREGRELVHFDRLHVSFQLDNMKVKFGNLFNGNQVLGFTVNNFLNQHALEVIGELHDNIGDSLAQIMKDLINNVFDKLPTDLWLPKEDTSE